MSFSNSRMALHCGMGMYMPFFPAQRLPLSIGGCVVLYCPQCFLARALFTLRRNSLERSSPWTCHLMPAFFRSHLRPNGRNRIHSRQILEGERQRHKALQAFEGLCWLL